MIGFCLAAGPGRRLAPVTSRTPKALLAPAGRPLIDLAWSALARAGAARVVVNLHHGADQLVPHLAGRAGLRTLREAELLGTGGGPANAWRVGMLGDDPDELVLLTCADAVVDPADLAALAAALERSAAPVAVGLVANAGLPRFRLDGDRAVSDPAGALSSAGVYALRAGVLDRVGPGNATLVDALLEPSWRRGELLGVLLRRDWADAGTLERFLAVSAGLLGGCWPYPLPPGRLLPGEAGPVLLVDGAVADPSARLEGPALLDAGSRVGPGALVARSVIGPGVSVGAGATVGDSLLGPGATIGDGEVANAALVAGR